MLKYLCLILIWLYPQSLVSQTTILNEENWQVSSSAVKFKLKNAKLTVIGRFEVVVAKIKFNPDDLKASYFEGSVNLSTINTGIPMRDKHLMRPEYFDAANYPEISIKTKSISSISTESYIATCLLTMKGKSKEVEMPFTSIKTGEKRLYRGNLIINRLDYGVGSPSVLMSKNIEIEINITTIPNERQN